MAEEGGDVPVSSARPSGRRQLPAISEKPDDSQNGDVASGKKVSAFLLYTVYF